MENTIENKEKYLALHWGQKCTHRSHDGGTYSGNIDSILFSNEGCIFDAYLELTPLSEISDIDAIEVMKILDCGNQATTEQMGKRIVLGIFEKQESNEWLNQYLVWDEWLAVSDFLRSKSYALPYNGLSIEALIQYGWLRLSNK